MDDKNTNRTIEYYNTHADRYSEITRNADMSDIYKRFEKNLKPGCRILDLGCGSGRDSKYFLDKGYKVVSLDASEAMCRKTQELTGKAAVHMRIEDMNYENEFDAVWACASLLHVAKSDMHKILEKAMKALKVGGVLYASWKYGKSERTRDDGRTFANYTEARVCDMVALVSGASLEDVWTSQDVRLDRIGQGHLWVNVLVKKTRVVITEKEFLNIFWKQYQIIEKDVRISSEYVDIHKSNFPTFSSRYINMFLNICSNIDSLIEIYCKMVEENDYRKKYNIHDRLTPVLRKFPAIRLDAVRTIDTFEDIELKPFSAFVDGRIADWWNDYNLVKHARSEKNEKTGKYNFQSANQKNVLTALAAYFIVCNRIYEEICEISATPKKLLKSKLFLYVKNGE